MHLSIILERYWGGDWPDCRAHFDTGRGGAERRKAGGGDGVMESGLLIRGASLGSLVRSLWAVWRGGDEVDPYGT